MFDKLFTKKKAATPIPDEDLLKYTGKTKDEINNWAKDRPGVAGNQNPGSITAGHPTGFGGYEAAKGYGGWGPSTNADPKFPPNKSNDDTTRALEKERELSGDNES